MRPEHEQKRKEESVFHCNNAACKALNNLSGKEFTLVGTREKEAVVKVISYVDKRKGRYQNNAQMQAAIPLHKIEMFPCSTLGGKEAEIDKGFAAHSLPIYLSHLKVGHFAEIFKL